MKRKNRIEEIQRRKREEKEKKYKEKKWKKRNEKRDENKKENEKKRKEKKEKKKKKKKPKEEKKREEKKRKRKKQGNLSAKPFFPCIITIYPFIPHPLLDSNSQFNLLSLPPPEQQPLFFLSPSSFRLSTLPLHEYRNKPLQQSTP